MCPPHANSENLEEGAVNVENVRREDWILAGLAVVLVIILVAFPWFSVGFGPIDINLTGTDSPDGWLGVLAVIALLALLADLALERFSPQTQVPQIGGSRAMTRFVLAVAAAGFMALKFIFHLGHFSDLGWGFWVGAIVAGGLVFFAMQERAAAPAGAVPRPASTPAPPAPSPSASTTPSAGTSEPPPSSPPPGA
jgi:protein-S-isoprenylcysteine O-methyltransferase Ste14